MLSRYAKNKRFGDAVDVFEAMPEKNVVSYNAMLSGYLGIGDFMSARKMFDEMGERNAASWNAMINGYVKVGRMREAYELFNEMPERNKVSYMIVISGCVGVNNVVTLADLVTLAMKMGYIEDVVVGTGILNAFTRVGNFDMALRDASLLRTGTYRDVVDGGKKSIKQYEKLMLRRIDWVAARRKEDDEVKMTMKMMVISLSTSPYYMRFSSQTQVKRLRLLDDYHHSTRIGFIEFVTSYGGGFGLTLDSESHVLKFEELSEFLTDTDTETVGSSHLTDMPQMMHYS
ncbi:Pentatricopeptide repeat-containing protein, mitochondrial [Capsicum baccatum]|uniref:Pentatricopeptide repeat-containing protein, mitochondrial n=1 Tax=Capsicum baccatum TaxID=33114 RepID=A0A2G2XMQ9_CAPBA|nr:Pentatricopeptide repeat-containing protein, mitochondrial [Capsicum baccatum]